MLLLAGANSNACWLNGESLLCSFARSGNVQMINLLIQFGANMDYVVPSSGETPLILAVRYGHLDAAQLLHQFNADLSITDTNGHCALVHAAIADSVPLLSFLLECDWSGQKWNGNAGSTSQCMTNGHGLRDRAQAIKQAFQTAAKLGNVRICRYLLDCTDAIVDMSEVFLNYFENKEKVYLTILNFSLILN